MGVCALITTNGLLSLHIFVSEYRESDQFGLGYLIKVMQNELSSAISKS